MTELPDPGKMTVAGYAQISRRFLEQAKVHLAEHDRLQAAEKVWGAAALALKAIGEQRGWVHNNHSKILCIGEHLGREFGRQREFHRYLLVANDMHADFYENEWRDEVIESARLDVEEFVGELEVIRNLAPRPYTVRDDSDRIRLGHLLGLQRSQRPAIGDYSPVGFSLTHGVV